MNKSDSHDAFVPKYSALKMSWKLENGRLQAKWATRKPDLIKPDLSSVLASQNNALSAALFAQQKVRQNNLNSMIEFHSLSRNLPQKEKPTMSGPTTNNAAKDMPQMTERYPDGSILLAVTPAPGHVNPMLAIACHLRDRGHSVLFNTGKVFREQVESKGIRFIPLTGKANFDYRTFNKFLLQGQTLRPGPEEMIHNIQHVFGDTMLDQCEGIEDILAQEPVSLILADFTFSGILPLLLSPTATDRPPIISFGVSPMVLSSTDASLFGPVITGDAGERNREETARFQTSTACANEYIDDLLRGYGCMPLPGSFFDCLYTLPDLFLQLTAEAFEFHRTDLPDHVKFVGPVLPRSSSTLQRSRWWKELDGSKRVVLVTQGAIANTDLNDLIGPTIIALATENVTVIAATGRPIEALTTPVPSNARVIPFVPFAELLPKVDVFVTNGGYGAVNQALSAGVPMVVAGETEDKAFVAARVAWSRAGINMHTSRPTPEQVREAVREVLNDGSYRRMARRMQMNFARYDALDRISLYIESLLRRGSHTSAKMPVAPPARRSIQEELARIAI